MIEVTTDSGKYVIAHADYPSDECAYEKPVDKHLVLWNRKRINAAMRGESNDVLGADKFIFCHTPLIKPSLFRKQLYTGTVFGNTLTLIHIQE